MIGQRISGWLELSFWQLVVRSLTLARGVTRQAVMRGQQAKTAKTLEPIRSIPRFTFQLATALAGWGLGIAIGYLLTQWWF